MRTNDKLLAIVLLLGTTLTCQPKTTTTGGIENRPFLVIKQGGSNLQAKLNASEQSSLNNAIQQVNANSSGRKGHIDASTSNGHLLFTPHYDPEHVAEKAEARIYSTKGGTSTTSVPVVPSDEALDLLLKRQ